MMARKFRYWSTCNSIYFSIAAIIVLDIEISTALKHQTTLLWAETDHSGRSKLVGVDGDPRLWSSNQTKITHIVTAPNSRSQFTSCVGDYSRQTIYLSDTANKRITAIKFDTNGTRLFQWTVFEGTSAHVNALAIDWKTGNIYWTDSVYNWIMVAAVIYYQKARNYQQVIGTDLDYPSGLAVHSNKGLLFWTDCGENPKIERSSLSGTDRQVIVRSSLNRPKSITVDLHQDRLLWTDYEDGTVNSVNLVGQSRKRHVTKNGAQFYGISIHQNMVFLTDQNYKQLSVYDSSSGVQHMSFSSYPSTPYCVTMYTASSQHPTTSDSVCKEAGCSQLCASHYENTVKCMCTSGFKLHSDGLSCSSDGLELYSPDTQSGLLSQIIYSIGDSICHFPVNFPDMNLEKVNLRSACFTYGRVNILSLSSDVRRGILFIADNVTRTISQIHLSDAEVTDVIVGNTGIVEGMSFDWISRNLYWTDSMFKHIMVCQSDGRYQSLLHSRELDHPRGITVDPIHRLLYWTDVGIAPRIERSHLDGSGRQTLVATNLGSPNNIIIDYLSSRFFWIDSKLERIESMTLEGLRRQVVLLIPGSSIYKITAFQDYLIWTDKGRRNGVHAAIKTTGEKIRGMVHPNIGVSFDIIVYDTSLQPLISGVCVDKNVCSQLCMPSAGNTVSCSCAVGFSLSSDNTTCRSDYMYDDFLLVTDSYQRQIYQVGLAGTTLGSVQGITLSADHDNPVAVDYDPIEKKLYWTDVESAVIKRAALDGSDEETLLSLPYGSIPDGLSLDVFSRLLYYTDAVRQVIATVDVQHFYHFTLIKKDIDKPRAICLDTFLGYMFWTDWGKDGGIERSNMDGSNRVKLSENKHNAWPNGITVDLVARRLYWCNARSGSIETIDYNGNSYQMIYQRHGAHYFGIASLPGDVLYLSDWTKKTVLKLVKFGSQYVEMDFGPEVFSRINGIRAYRQQHGSTGLNITGCSTRNGGCRFLCLPRPFRGRTCVCPDNIKCDDNTTESGNSSARLPSLQPNEPKIKQYQLVVETDHRNKNQHWLNDSRQSHVLEQFVHNTSRDLVTTVLIGHHAKKHTKNLTNGEELEVLMADNRFTSEHTVSTSETQLLPSLHKHSKDVVSAVTQSTTVPTVSTFSLHEKQFIFHAGDDDHLVTKSTKMLYVFQEPVSITKNNITNSSVYEPIAQLSNVSSTSEARDLSRVTSSSLSVDETGQSSVSIHPSPANVSIHRATSRPAIYSTSVSPESYDNSVDDSLLLGHDHLTSDSSFIEVTETVMAISNEYTEIITNANDITATVTPFRDVTETVTTINEVKYTVTPINAVTDTVTPFHAVAETVVPANEVTETVTSINEVTETLISTYEAAETVTPISEVTETVFSINKAPEAVTAILEVAETVTTIVQYKDDNNVSSLIPIVVDVTQIVKNRSDSSTTNAEFYSQSSGIESDSGSVTQTENDGSQLNSSTDHLAASFMSVDESSEAVSHMLESSEEAVSAVTVRGSSDSINPSNVYGSTELVSSVSESSESVSPKYRSSESVPSVYESSESVHSVSSESVPSASSESVSPATAHSQHYHPTQISEITPRSSVSTTEQQFSTIIGSPQTPEDIQLIQTDKTGGGFPVTSEVDTTGNIIVSTNRVNLETHPETYTVSVNEVLTSPLDPTPEMTVDTLFNSTFDLVTSIYGILTSSDGVAREGQMTPDLYEQIMSKSEDTEDFNGGISLSLSEVVSVVCSAVFFVALVTVAGVVVCNRLKLRHLHRPSRLDESTPCDSRITTGLPVSQRLQAPSVDLYEMNRCARHFVRLSDDFYTGTVDTVSTDCGHDNSCYMSTSSLGSLHNIIAAAATEPTSTSRSNRHVTFSTFIDDDSGCCKCHTNYSIAGINSLDVSVT